MALTQIGFLDAGIPKTDAERASAHYGIPLEEIDPPLTPKGTGLRGINDTYVGLKAWQWIVLVLGVGVIFFIMYKQGKKNG